MEFITSNGQKKVVINTATFKEMCDLKKEAMKCIQQAADSDVLNNFKDVSTVTALDAIIKALIAADTSADFEKALFVCLGHCFYDEFYTINEQFFEDHKEAIDDYYEIVAKCIEENLRPFFKSLVTAFNTHLQKLGLQNQEQQ